VSPARWAAALALLAAPWASGQDSPTPEGPYPPRILMRTAAGDLVLALDPQAAPRHVEQILKLVQSGVYDGTHFFRIQPDFVIQLSTAQDRRPPLSAEQLALIHPLPQEVSDLIHRPGALSMARREDDPDSAETSFSIMLDFAPHLDGHYTVFGHVERGVDVLQELLRVPRDEQSRPTHRLGVEFARVVRPDVPTDAVPLLAAHPVASRADAPIRATSPELPGAPDSGERTVFLVAIGAMALVSLAAFLTAGASPRRLPTALALLNVLIGLFFLLALLTPLSQQRGWLALLLFAAVLGVLKLLGRFERSGSA